MCESALALLERDPLSLATADHRVSVRKDGRTTVEVRSGKGMPECPTTMKTSVCFSSREGLSGEDSEGYAMTRYAFDIVRDSARCL